MHATMPSISRNAPVDDAPAADVVRGVDEMLRRWRAVVLDRLHKLAALLLLPPLLLVLAVQWHPERLCGDFARDDAVDGAVLLREFFSIL